MFQEFTGELPPMSTAVLALRREVWDADGIHLIYNVPRKAAGVSRKAPMRPFSGLCVAFLFYLEKDKEQFAPQLGDVPKAYQIGWSNKDQWGLYSITAVNSKGGQDGWEGYKDKNHSGFNAGYYYVYFYFKNKNTLNGWINNTELQSDSTKPYDVSKVSDTILFGQQSWHDVATLETHWVVWSSAHNRGGSPSKSLKNQLFTKNDRGNISYQWATALHVHTGGVITIMGEYEQNPNQSAEFKAAVVPVIAGAVGNDVYRGVYWNSVPCQTCLFKLQILERHFDIFYKSYEHVAKGNAKTSAFTGSFYVVLMNLNPQRIYVETMGWAWK